MRRRSSALRSFPLAALVALALLTALIPARAANPRGAYYSSVTDRVFWFVHFSDIHVGMRGSTESTNLNWLVTTGRTVINPSFMVATGDLTDSTNGNLFGIPNGPYQAEWDQYKNILAAAGVDALFYYDLPGNHDAYSDRTFAYYRANSVQGRVTNSTQVSWIKTFPFGKYHFLGVNSCDNTGAAFSLVWPWGDYAGLDETELAYITSQLNDETNASCDLTMVFGHHPVTDTGDSDDTWLNYGHVGFISTLDSHFASLYGYGHTHRQSDAQFTGNTYTGLMANGGVRYENIASVGKSTSYNYDIVAIDCNGVSSVPATIKQWPVVLITAPVAKTVGGTANPYAYTVPADSVNPIRALVFDAAAVTSVQYKVDSEATWHAMSPVSGNPKLWQGVWNASTLAAGDHTITVQATGTSTKSHAITVTVTAGSAPNNPPVAAGDAYTTDQDTLLSDVVPGVLGNDTDADGNTLTAVLVSNSAHGTLDLNANGSFSYAPAAGYYGTDSFTYKANDSKADSNIAVVTITVKQASALPDTVTILTAEYKKKTRQLTVQATSSRQPNVTLTVAGYGQMTYGSSSYTFTKKVTSQPASVTVTSSGGGSATKAVTVK
jgi:hypothetical protein